MADFYQTGEITTLHDLGTARLDRLESLLDEATRKKKLGLVLPVTAGDMRAAPFTEIIQKLAGANYLETIVVTLGVAPDVADYQQTRDIVAPLGQRVAVLWTDGPRVQQLYRELIDADFHLSVPGKGRSAWTAYGYLLADPQLSAFVLHDCDIVDYDRIMLARLCLPMVHASYDFEFCKAFYARTTDRMHGRVVRLLVLPLLDAMFLVLGDDAFLRYMRSFRYPLAGEFAMTANMARSNRIPSDWGLEVGTLAEVFRNTSTKRVCQVDLCADLRAQASIALVGRQREGLDENGTGHPHHLFPHAGQSWHDATARTLYILAGRLPAFRPGCDPQVSCRLGD